MCLCVATLQSPLLSCSPLLEILSLYPSSLKCTPPGLCFCCCCLLCCWVCIAFGRCCCACCCCGCRRALPPSLPPHPLFTRWCAHHRHVRASCVCRRARTHAPYTGAPFTKRCCDVVCVDAKATHQTTQRAAASPVCVSTPAAAARGTQQRMLLLYFIPLRAASAAAGSGHLFQRARPFLHASRTRCL